MEVETTKIEKKVDLTPRLIDLVSPIGKGQRSLIISPPKAGKTMILKCANSITANHPECYLMVLLIDERPEEVTDMQRTVKERLLVLHLMNLHKTRSSRKWLSKKLKD